MKPTFKNTHLKRNNRGFLHHGFKAVFVDLRVAVVADAHCGCLGCGGF